MTDERPGVSAEFFIGVLVATLIVVGVGAVVWWGFWS